MSEQEKKYIQFLRKDATRTVDEQVTAVRSDDREAVMREVRKLLAQGWKEITRAEYVAFGGREPFS